MGIADAPGYDFYKVRSALAGEKPADGGLADSGLTADEDVVQGLAALLRRAGGDEEVLDRAALPDKVFEAFPCRSSARRKRRGLFAGLQDLRERPPVGAEDETFLAPLDQPLDRPPLESGELARQIGEGIEGGDLGRLVLFGSTLRSGLRAGKRSALDHLQRNLLRLREDLRRGPRLPDHVPVAVEGGHRPVVLDAEDDASVVHEALALPEAECHEPRH